MGLRPADQLDFDGRDRPAGPRPTDDPTFAVNFGDLSIHEVEVARGDPDEGEPNIDDDKLAYFSW
jgi:hypothetical protein